ncbi:DUF2628 domain-containing protein [Limosilactobacillus fastidiosus]|uniref:DUF2628 domain-containing protein n=1 Tax=Limosilactobacillus fastidiosus TaxID=2759855 RepID=A0A7W3YCL7_9LACO|nr:DUF2628 domain-containing protein [Limosilactobacillus fastidiosus]MBB1063774.1 DUF2628 domain-containing protein [Limosilactobacillus fastidiosus]MBB1086355.1 DUF2628 domain-containing protein [Limosilactobacillus fastidiosus]MCD7084349.1 DUF2628 domain-containing protein [Limosilactobacillus fastidiosus]MCD7086270.1 DUF2628 domain-containing protein [Limosilactobacillus fastidiosus]MCD7115033.1 DUF2628 domain-containing protein [Limosilactobacillus fastidiosus]
MRVNLKNPNTHQLKQVKVGFSWTTFFFGFWPALFRGDWKWFGIQLIIVIFVACFTFGLGTGIVGIVFSFFYNKLYINDLLESGYVPNDKTSEDILLSKGITVASN